MITSNSWLNACEQVAQEDRNARRQAQSGSADRRTVAAGEPHEVAYFAKKHGISKEQTLELIKRFGNDRKNAYAKAEKLKGTAGKL